MKFTLVFIFLFQFINPMQANEWVKIRNLYEQAAIKEDAQLKLNALLLSKVENAVLNGYKGANLMISAKYVFNPVRKLSRFNKGKVQMEHAIEREPKNLELRYLRFTIQTNLPVFLGYSGNIIKDKEFLISHLATVSDVDLRNRIVAYLISSRRCSDSELKEVMVWKNK